MPKFIITWDMSGETEIDAPNEEAALNEFATYSADEIFDTNNHYDYEANTPGDLKAKRLRARHGNVQQVTRHG